MNKKLIWFGVIAMIIGTAIQILLAATAHASAGPKAPPQPTSNQTNILLSKILEQEKLNTQLQQDNNQVLAIKLDIIKTQLEQILMQMKQPPGLPPNPFPPACSPGGFC